MFPLALNPEMMLWSAINFLVLFLLLRRYLWRPVLDLLAAREREITSQFEQAENAREEAVRMKEEYERRLAEAQRRAEEMVAKAGRRAEEMSNELRARAQAEAAALLERAEETIRREKEQALAELREQVADLALEVASRVLERSVTDADHERLARQFLDRMATRP